MGITCQILHPSGEGRWRSPTSSLSGRLVAGSLSPFIIAMETSSPEEPLPELLPGEDGPAALWLGDSHSGARLAPDARLGGWTRTLSADESKAFGGARVLVAVLPDDLARALLVFALENESELYGGWGLYSLDLADLLAAADTTLHGSDWTPEDRRLAFEILCARSRGEAVYAEARARRIEKKAAQLAAKNYALEDLS